MPDIFQFVDGPETQIVLGEERLVQVARRRFHLGEFPESLQVGSPPLPGQKSATPAIQDNRTDEAVLLGWPLLSGAGDVFLDSGAPAPAILLKRTVVATGVARRADQGSQFHEGLVEVLDARGNRRSPDQAIKQFPKVPLHRRPYIADAKKAGQHSFYVAVQDRFGESIRNRKYGTRGVDSHTRQRQGRSAIRRKVASVFPTDDSGRPPQIFGPAVIAKPGPCPYDPFLFGPGQGLNRRKELEKTLIVGQHRVDLSLLQHGLSHPDSIGIALTSPGKVAPSALIPLQELLREEGA